MKKEILSSFFLATAAGLLSSIAGLGCSDASAMAKSQAAAPSVATVPAAIAPVAAVESAGLRAGGGYADGYSLGLRNGSIIVSRLKQRTTDLRGCQAVGQLETALLSVSRTVRPPYSGETAFVGGFYSGYVDSIRATLGKLRQGCGLRSYSSGEFAGEFYGAVACQVVSLEAVAEVQIQPLYDGWSGGSSSIQASCKSTLLATLESCTDGAEISGELEAALSVSCSDQAGGDSRD
jgi:hypothetical protein